MTAFRRPSEQRYAMEEDEETKQYVSENAEDVDVQPQKASNFRRSIIARRLSSYRYVGTKNLRDMAQIPLGSSRHDSTRSTLSSESRRACRASRAVLYLHGGRRTSYSVRLYKFSRFYAPAYTNPICSVK